MNNNNNDQTQPIINTVLSNRKSDFTRTELDLYIQLTTISTKLDGINTTMLNQNEKIDNYKTQTDKLIYEVRSEVKELKKEHREEIDKLEMRVDKQEKFNLKIFGALIILSLFWAAVSKQVIGFIFNGGFGG